MTARRNSRAAPEAAALEADGEEAKVAAVEPEGRAAGTAGATGLAVPEAAGRWVARAAAAVGSEVSAATRAARRGQRM